MGELYGGAFVATYGEQPTPLWMNAIAGLSDEQCRDGLSRLAREPREWPANLTQFVAACFPPKQPVRYLGRPISESERATLYLPKPVVDREKVDFYLAKMRRACGVS